MTVNTQSVPNDAAAELIQAKAIAVLGWALAALLVFGPPLARLVSRAMVAPAPAPVVSEGRAND